MSTHLPRTRSTDLVLRTVGDEVVVYDTSSDSAHALSPLAAGLWPLLDGATTPEAAARQLGASEAEVAATVVALDDAGLLAAGHDRRAFLTRAAVVAGGVVALPVVTSLAVPTAAAAASFVVGGGSTSTFVLYDQAARRTPLSSTAGPFSFLQSPAGSAGPYTTVSTPDSDGPISAVRGSDTGGGFGAFPIFAINTTGTLYDGRLGTIPANSFDVHPGASTSAVVGFTFPAGTTTYGVSFTISDNAPGGADGVAFALFEDGTRIAAGDGVIADGGTATRTIGAAPRSGAVLYLIVDPTASFGSDSTRVDFSITCS